MSELKHLTPPQAYELLQENPRAMLIDVRSTMEHLFVGHPRGAVHIPWMDEPDWVVDPNFITRVRELTLGGAMESEGGAVPLLLICRSGQRTLEAGRLLVDNGFAEVYNVLEGFEGNLDSNHQRSTTGGWRFHGLPWEQC